MEQDNTKYSYTEIIKATVAILLMFGSLYAAYSYIDWRIDQRINSPEFIQQIASNVRPSVIFDSQESIENDMGAMQFIEEITIIPSDDPRFPKEIIVSPTKYLAHAPFLESLDRVEFNMHTERGKKYDWVYYLIVSQHPTDINKSRFHLEILQ